MLFHCTTFIWLLYVGITLHFVFTNDVTSSALTKQILVKIYIAVDTFINVGDPWKLFVEFFFLRLDVHKIGIKGNVLYQFIRRYIVKRQLVPFNYMPPGRENGSESSCLLSDRLSTKTHSQVKNIHAQLMSTEHSNGHKLSGK